MNTLSYKTQSANRKTVNKQWVLVDAENETLGRLASKVAKMIRGKHKTNYTPHVDCGDNVVVVNAEKVRLTGNKMTEKTYISYSEYPGGQKSITAEELLKKKPAALVEKAVRGMLSKNRLGRALFGNLHVVVGTDHQYEAQKPKEIKLNSIK